MGEEEPTGEMRSWLLKCAAAGKGKVPKQAGSQSISQSGKRRQVVYSYLRQRRSEQKRVERWIIRLG